MTKIVYLIFSLTYQKLLTLWTIRKLYRNIMLCYTVDHTETRALGNKRKKPVLVQKLTNQKKHIQYDSNDNNHNDIKNNNNNNNNKNINSHF